MTRALRAGRKVGRTLYDADTGELVGVMDTRELAAEVVAAMGGRAEVERLRERVRASEAHADKLRAWLEETYETARRHFRTNAAMVSDLDALRKKHREEN